MDKRLIKMLLYAVSILGSQCSLAQASAPLGWKATADFQKLCGLAIKIPESLKLNEAGLPPCQGNYSVGNGALLSLGVGYDEPHDSNWFDRMPLLRIQRVSISQRIRTERLHDNQQKALGSRSNASGGCYPLVKTKITKIKGDNWHGWIAEEVYGAKSVDSHPPEFCERYSQANRCLSMVIGNSVMSAATGQSCLSKNPKDFDLDVALDYGYFMDMVKSIRFVEGR